MLKQTQIVSKRLTLSAAKGFAYHFFIHYQLTLLDRSREIFVSKPSPVANYCPD